MGGLFNFGLDAIAHNSGKMWLKLGELSRELDGAKEIMRNLAFFTVGIILETQRSDDPVYLSFADINGRQWDEQHTTNREETYTNVGGVMSISSPSGGDLRVVEVITNADDGSTSEIVLYDGTVDEGGKFDLFIHKDIVLKVYKL